MDSWTSTTADAHCTLRVAGTSRRCEHSETVHSKTECPSMAAHSCGSSIVGADRGCRGGEIGALGGAGGRASHTSWRATSAATARSATPHAVARRAQAETKRSSASEGAERRQMGQDLRGAAAQKRWRHPAWKAWEAWHWSVQGASVVRA
eukprot:scaffold6539_cov103-Isochrysis_galbana.AAC.1